MLSQLLVWGLYVAGAVTHLSGGTEGGMYSCSGGYSKTLTVETQYSVQLLKMIERNIICTVYDYNFLFFFSLVLLRLCATEMYF